jgi:2-hydroxy-6-oxonona-2,4-dienedioate hydrolase
MTTANGRRGTAAHELRRTDVQGRSVASRVWPGPQRPTDGATPVTSPTTTNPVVLVHGLVVSSRYHVPLGDLLARHRSVHAPDLPGYGESEGHEGRHLDTRELGRALAHWLDAEGLREVVLVGNSYGCQIAAETAMARPELVHRLVLLGPTMDRRGRQLDEQLRRWRLESRTQTPALQAILARDYAAAGVARAKATLQHALADAIEDKLPFLDVPTLVVRGTRDPIVPQRWAEEVTDLLPDAELVVLPGATHAVNHEQPRQAARVIERFLEPG